MAIGLTKIVRLFKQGSVCVTGMRGTGKDVLFGNVISRIGKPYVSNLDYGGDREELDLSKLDMGGNTYSNFLSNEFNQFVYPYKKGADIYISDVGVYLPSQYCNELNKRYPYLPSYVALSRQISRNNIHFNVQNLNRAWDKFREQSDIYIKCNWCKVFFGKIVFQHVTLYDKAESCQARVKPCKIKIPLFCFGQHRTTIDMYLDNFYNTHGMVQDVLLVYINRSKHDTYDFEKKLKVVYSSEENNS